MPHYWVVSPEMEGVEPVLDDGSGPIGIFRCVCCIDAPNKAQAKLKALNHPDMKEWIKQQREDKKNPWAGLKVQDAKCKHGVCTCDIQGCLEIRDYCEECEKEYKGH